MLNRTKIGIGSITFHRKGPMRDQHYVSPRAYETVSHATWSPLYQSPEKCIHFYIQLIFMVFQPLVFLK